MSISVDSTVSALGSFRWFIGLTRSAPNLGVLSDNKRTAVFYLRRRLQLYLPEVARTRAAWESGTILTFDDFMWQVSSALSAHGICYSRYNLAGPRNDVAVAVAPWATARYAVLFVCRCMAVRVGEWAPCWGRGEVTRGAQGSYYAGARRERIHGRLLGIATV